MSFRNENSLSAAEGYKVVRTKRRTIGIQVFPGGEVVVRAPLRMPEWQIRAFVFAKREWILRAQEQMKKRPVTPELTEAEIKELRKRAKAYIPGRVEYWSTRMGVRPTAVRFTSAKTRWGSCSSKNSVSFSVRLMDKPPEAIDYVVVHELAHIREHNHSTRFWAVVAAYMPDYKERKKLLRQ